MKKNSIIRVIIGTSIILSVPLIAMMFTDEVAWDLSDFIVIGSLLLGAGLGYEFTANKVDRRYRGVIAVVLAAFLLIIWMELAVGLFGSPFAGS